ncbi:HlyD family secretion protein [Zobellella aerophila]|uniref:HlyD family secretion protein n=1 Tax=Zobellella aerophila TaxID=870480 RepID=A0ABP6W191_9GAMM
MTPEQSFSRWVRGALLAFFLLFAYFILADNYMPMTPQAQVQRFVAPVAARVAGQVSRVYVENNQHVEAGTLLFEVDDSDYRLAEQQAELKLALARVEQGRLGAARQAAEATLQQERIQADELSREARRVGRLHRQGHMSVQQREQAASRAEQAQSRLRAIEARLGETVQAGKAGEVQLRQAENALSQARLALSRTRVRAEVSGKIGNLQLQEGTYTQVGQPLLALVSDQAWVTADLREKSLRHVAGGTPVDIVFDALPGQIFSGRISNIDSGVRDGQQLADGRLAQPANSDRWVRDAQRLRTHIRLEQDWPPLATGAKATVQLYPSDNLLLRGLGRMQAWLVSQLRYLY